MSLQQDFYYYFNKHYYNHQHLYLLKVVIGIFDFKFIGLFTVYSSYFLLHLVYFPFKIYNYLIINIYEL